ncbi:MAG: hypothetical protein VYB44_12075 [Bacteroidota bacterium]|nr:hypothetical protein [Bacteroidota bacterium]
MDVTVVIRAAGERTEKLCQYIIEQQVPSDQVYVIHERPFWKAVQRTFEIGIQQKRKWTIAVDADVLLRMDAIARMINIASELRSPFFCYQGYVMDYVFGRPRDGGPHLYNTTYIPKALEVLKSDSTIHRPESDTYKELAKLGIYTFVDNIVFGTHDYYQHPRDYYRKAYFHAVKNSRLDKVPDFFNHWVTKMSEGDVYNLMIQGWLHGRKESEVQVDIDFFREKVQFLGSKEESELGESMFAFYCQCVQAECEKGDAFKVRSKVFPRRKTTPLDTARNWLGKKVITVGRLIKEGWST